MNKLVIIGASGHGKVIADIAEKNGYSDIVFLDDNPEAKQCGKYDVVGGSEHISAYKCADFIVAIGNAGVRRRIQEELVRKGINVITLVHPSAVIAQDVKIGDGTIVAAGAVINPSVEIGQGCIVNTCASVDHDCKIGDFVHISVGAHVAGTVKINENTWVGAGATISNNLEITGDCMIGAGSVVVKSITEKGTYMGVPARKRGEKQ